MTPNNYALFNDFAGIQYAVMGLSNIVHQRNLLNRPSLFLWMLFCEGVARSEKNSDILQWVENQLSIIAKDAPTLKNYFIEEIPKSWTPWLALSIFSKDEAIDELIRNFHPTEEKFAFFKLLNQLTRSQGKTLFSPENWGDDINDSSRYSDPFSCSVVKLGIVLKKLAQKEDNQNFSLFTSWKKKLREEVLLKLPIDSLSTFDNRDEDDFLKLVKSTYMTANLLISPDHQNLVDKILKRSSDFDDDQLIFIGALFGWVRGYKKIANLVQDIGKRSYLSSLALRLSFQLDDKNHTLAGADPVILFSSKRGDRINYENPFCRVTKIESITTFEEFDVKKTEKISIGLGDNVFQFTFNLPYHD